MENNYRTITVQPVERERWVPIKGYEGVYEISSYGRCRSITRETQFGNQTKLIPTIILKPKKRKKRYSSYSLSKDGQIGYFMIHRLVAIHFILNPDNKPCVNHKDGNKWNNHVSNLEWVTYKENNGHAMKTGLRTHVLGDWSRRPENKPFLSQKNSGDGNPTAIKLNVEQKAFVIECGQKGYSARYTRLLFNQKFDYHVLKSCSVIKRTFKEANIVNPFRIKKGHKITADIARCIRAKAQAGECKETIADEYQLTKGMVQSIINFKSWKHV